MNKNHTAILIEAEKALDRIQHPFMIKYLNKLDIEGMYLNIIKPTTNREELKDFPLRSGQDRNAYSTLPFNTVQKS
jgi:hypothetical protein